MACHSYSIRVQRDGVHEHTQRTLRVIQCLAHEGVTLKHAVRHGVVVPQPIEVLRLGALHRPTPIFKRLGIGRQYRKTSPSQSGAKGLIAVSHQTGHLALAEVELAVVLMKYHHATLRCAVGWREQKGRDVIAVMAQILDTLAAVSVGVNAVGSPEFNAHRFGKSQSCAEGRGKIGRHMAS
ncbi:MAG: hypothetical protein C0516_09550 [Gemmatimonas sp.]|nr:hypothetical protein [Gemmatimonas sp.]